ncbi:hypothetical protein chiPu_0005470 [Chiloscyllium punctatum]|uniref:Uncharacterized protein n=1 Tax=Chiloscyllium punctatum TaxID=137246 RepID=A0A401S9H6_CHIPU|nr:hypothetical protein [Chiloscyllium punctatum]
MCRRRRPRSCSCSRVRLRSGFTALEPCSTVLFKMFGWLSGGTSKRTQTGCIAKANKSCMNHKWHRETINKLSCSKKGMKYNGIRRLSRGGYLLLQSNFLQTGKLLVPDKFSEIDVLVTEMEMLQIPELIKAVKTYRSDIGGSSKDVSIPVSSVRHSEGDCNNLCEITDKPLYVLVLELSWLGTCRLPLTEDVSQMCAVCVFLDQHDNLYQPVKDAMQLYLQTRKRETIESNFKISSLDDSWAADVDSHTLLQIVKVYVGNYWYATYLNTFLKGMAITVSRNRRM